MVTSRSDTISPSLVHVVCASRKAVREASAARGNGSSRDASAPEACTDACASRSPNARCTRLLHMWTPDAHMSNGTVTSMLQLYRVDHYESHGECTHIVSLDAAGWRCRRSEHCGAVALARAEHERLQRLRGASP